MPYKDRETYLRKQREFHARRKARAENSRVSGKSPLTPLTRGISSHKRPVLVRASASDPNRGIGLRFEPTVKEKFQVDDCGNAWRTLGPK
jgi:hypothetical protein